MGLAAAGVVAAALFALAARRSTPVARVRTSQPGMASLPEPAWEPQAAAPPAVPASAPGPAAEPSASAAPVAPATCPVDGASAADVPRPQVTREWLLAADGYARAEQERAAGAPVLVYFYTDWCPYCRRLDENLLSAWEVDRYLGERLSRVRVNPEKGSTERALARQYGVKGYPTLFLVWPTGAQESLSPYRDDGTADLQAPVEFTGGLDEKIARQAQRLAYDGAQHRMAGDAAGAIALLDKSLGLDPGSAVAWTERGLARAAGGDMDGSLADLRQAREVDGSRLGVYEAIDFVLGQKNRWAEAARCWDALVEREPRLARAYYRRGGSLFRAGDRTHALADAEAACSLGDAQGCEVRGKLKP